MAPQASPGPDVVVVRADASRVEELRARVLRRGWDLDRLRYDEDADPRTASFVATLVGRSEPVGTATVFPEPCRWAPEAEGAWRLRAMATDDGLRGRGIGTAVLAAAVDHVAEVGGRLVWCDARVAARAFYERNGFVVEGGRFEVEGIGPHWPMTRHLP